MNQKKIINNNYKIHKIYQNEYILKIGGEKEKRAHAHVFSIPCWKQIGKFL